MSDIPAVLEAYMQGLKSHDVAQVAETVAENLAFVTPQRTLSKPQFLAMLTALYAAFPDWHYEHDEPEVLPGRFAVRWRQGGTHTAALEVPGIDSVPPTGKQVHMPAQRFFYRVPADLIVEIEPEPLPGGAPGGILQRLGVSQPPF